MSKLQSHASCDEDAKMPLLPADSFTYQFYRAKKPQNDRSPCIDTPMFDNISGARLHEKVFFD